MISLFNAWHRDLCSKLHALEPR
uniref:Uncharacterized protein n=1 Tax=Anguilla anguilla TaxID=7936 RepID=A0A0E9QM41_ANGAN